MLLDDTRSFKIVKNYEKSTAQVIVNEISDWSIQNKSQFNQGQAKNYEYPLNMLLPSLVICA